MQLMKRLFGLRSAVLLPFMVAVAGGWYFLHIWRSPTLSNWRLARIGASEQEVRELLGSPKKEYSKASAPFDWCAQELACRERPISGKLLVYHGQPDLTMIVWIDVNGNVEDIFIGGS